MEVVDSGPGNFEVSFTRESIVKAISNPFPEPKILSLSNLDLLSGRFPVTYFYFYQNVQNVNYTTITESLKSSLSETLEYYYPFSGRITEKPETGEPEVICDNTGALVVEAQANIPLKQLNFYNLDLSLKGKLVSVNSGFPVQVQVTSYTCGGISITFSFDHALGDASSFGKFLVSWSELARKKPVSCIPDHSRNLFPRCPPTYHPSVDQTYIKCSLHEILNIPMKKRLIKRLYFIDASSINNLQILACADGTKRTKIEAFSAYIWKIMVKAIDECQEKCKMGWLVNGRGRIREDYLMSNYIGNVLSVAVGESSVEDLNKGSISDIANHVHEAISSVANEDHFLDLIDWIECHRPGLMMSKIVLGLGDTPALVLSSGRRFPVSEVDFGFGSPVLGTVCSTIERIGVGYMNQRPSARDDGSWTVSAILWPELAAALESDSIFQPMSATLLQF
ncbi:transferase family protein [Tripterygium wilfordii]|uniref:Transferase family protein n=1 Tax=Tripterygium wilfordii TaxID=458696 RepID=A0A7J7CMI5_TRIWF|nr:coniferyl alcohol acyltransferase [Tripterygium wilfordii]KAF5735238.1 transferase family protein [Tripterygium wilfordii]